jgi:hypothetical protein
VIAYGMLAITLAVKYLNLVDHRPGIEIQDAVEIQLAAAD